MATSDRSGARRPRSLPRGGNGKFVPSEETAQRDAEACRLRTAGATLQQIADHLGFSDRGSAERAIDRGLLAIRSEPAGELRTLIAGRLDAALVKAFEALRARHIVVSNGRVMHDPRTGEPMLDYGPALAAAATIVRIEAQRSKLFGLDAPTRVETVTLDQVEAEISRLSNVIEGTARETA